MFCNTPPETVGTVNMVMAADHRVPKYPLKPVFEFAENLLLNYPCWMIAPSAGFQESTY